MSAKYEFASEEGVGQVRRILLELSEGQDLSHIETIFCEKFTNPPRSLSSDGSPVGWYLKVSGGTLEVNSGIVDADFTVVADYEFVLPLARATHAELAKNPPDAEEAATKMRREGDPSKVGSLTFMGPLHDLLVEVTV